MLSKQEHPSKFEFIKHLKSGAAGNVSLYKYRGSDPDILKIAVNQGFLVAKTPVEKPNQYIEITSQNEKKIAGKLDSNKIGKQYLSSMLVKIGEEKFYILEYVPYKKALNDTIPTSADLEDFASKFFQSKTYQLISRNTFRFLLDRLTASMWEAQDQLHEQNVLHLDTAPRNYLITTDYSTKICDFGLSQQFIDKNYGIAQTVYPYTQEILFPGYLYNLKSSEFRQAFDFVADNLKELNDDSQLLFGNIYIKNVETGVLAKWVDENGKTCQKIIIWSDFVSNAPLTNKEKEGMTEFLLSKPDSFKPISNKIGLAKQIIDFSIHHDLFSLKIAMMDMIACFMGEINLIPQNYNSNLLFKDQLLVYYNALLVKINLIQNDVLKETLGNYLKDNKIYLTTTHDKKRTVQELRQDEKELMQNIFQRLSNEGPSESRYLKELIDVLGEFSNEKVS